MTEKKCSHCLQIKPKADYYWDYKNNWFSSGKCKQCLSDLNKLKTNVHKLAGVLPIKAKRIPNSDNSYVTPSGEVWGYHKLNGYYKRRTHLNVWGYEKVGIRYGKKPYICSVHRLVAETFLYNWDSNLEVNHIDGNKLNNNVTNLEMCTRQDNIKHMYKLIKNGNI